MKLRMRKITLPAAGAQPSEAALLERRLREASRALLAERLWRLCAALAALALFFLALSWSGLWLEVGRIGRIVGVAGFAQAAAFIVAREALRGLPRRKEALARLDAQAPPGLRPAASLGDTLASERPDPATATLWEAHRRRLAQALRVLRLAPPDPDLARRDPYALRALALVAAVAAGFAAGEDKNARLLAAFDWRGAAGADAVGARLDIWLDPPAYTGRPSLVLEAKDADSPEPIVAPINSVLHIRVSSGAKIETSGALTPLPETPQRNGVRDQTYKLAGAARVLLPDGRAFALAALPDNPPTIAFTEPPRANLRGSLSLAYRTQDDYGVASAEAVVSRPGGPRPLVAPPKFALTLPAGANGIGDARSTLDVSDSPWAGARVALTLVARDDAGGEGRSRPVEVVLPQRPFTKPLARALVEQRRELVLDPDGRLKVAMALEALSIAPEVFDTPSAIHLGLRTARRGLDGNRSDAELLEVADLLWAMALHLEDGDASQAERDLRAAERNLRDALAQGADEEEIAKRTQELRQALDKFLQSLAEKADRDGGRPPAPQGGAKGRSLSEKDLKQMLDALAKAGKAGDLAKAQEMLDELQNLLENLQPAQGGEGGTSESARALSELDRLAREQQQLRDDVFRRARPGDEAGDAERGQPAPGKRGPPRRKDGGDDEAGQQDAARQQALRDRLDRQLDALRRSGEEAPGDLGEADKAMKEAEDALGKGEAGQGKALDAQGRALQALRRGADQLASKMKQGGEDGEQGAEGDSGEGGEKGAGAGRSAGETDRADPLGRARGSLRGYDPNALAPALRARRVQEELRRRLGQPDRPAEELDYLERLLRRQ